MTSRRHFDDAQPTQESGQIGSQMGPSSLGPQFKNRCLSRMEYECSVQYIALLGTSPPPLLLLLLLHPFSRTTWVSRHQKDKPFWILLEQEMMGWQWHQLDHAQIIRTSLQTDNHVSTSPLGFYRPYALPAANNSVKALTISVTLSTARCTEIIEAAVRQQV